MSKADLKVSLTGPDVARPGQRLTYALEVRNIGTSVARDVLAVVEISGLEDVAAEPGRALHGSLIVSTTTLTGLRWALGNLEPAARGVVLVTGAAAADVSTAAVLGGASTSSPETLLLNNIASVSTTVSGSPVCGPPQLGCFRSRPPSAEGVRVATATTPPSA